MRSKSDMFPYQDRGVTAFYEHDGIIAVVPMGGGKTVMSYTAAVEMMNDGVIAHGWIMAPKRPAQLVWPKEIKEWEHLEDLIIARMTGGPHVRKALFDTGLVDTPHFSIVHHDILDWWVDQMLQVPADHPYYDLLVIDEISRFRNPKSKRGKKLMAKRCAFLKRFRNIWGLTGTMRPDGYEDLFKPAQIATRGKLWGLSFYSWQDQRFTTDRNGYEWTIKDAWEQPTIDEFAQICFAVDPAELPELPELNYRVSYIDLPFDIMREYRRMSRDLFSRWLPAGWADEVEKGITISASNKGVATGKLAQIAQGFMYDKDGALVHVHDQKRDWLVDVLDSMNATPLLVSYEFLEDLRAIEEIAKAAFGSKFELPYLGNGTSEKQAAKWEAAWNKRELPILALHPFSAGHGLNLQHGGSHLAAYGMTWSSEFWDQMIKRFHRTGQRERCFVHICLARGTVDEMKYDRVFRKMSAQQAFNEHLKRI